MGQDSGPIEKECVVADPSNPVEFYALLNMFIDLNTKKAIYQAQFVYELSERVRDHEIAGKYTVTVVSELKEDKTRKDLWIITCIDKETGLPLTNLENKEIKKTENMLRTKGLEALAKKRGIQLAAARTHSYKPVFSKKNLGPTEQDAVKLKRRVGAL